ncbi:MAG: transglutaminase family protein [Methylobacterium sp.]|nr:transglutaminase family protein [Methylobacterium sp.]
MQLIIEHRTRLDFESPVDYTIQELHLTPLDGFGQRVKRWEIRVNGKMQPHADPYGNLAHTLVVEGAHRSIEITAGGEVETDLDTPPPADRLPLPVYLRSTALTETSPDMLDFARRFGTAGGGLDSAGLHALMRAVRERVAFDAEAKSGSAAAAFAAGRGDSAAQTHVFIACCRSLGVPARFVSGYLFSASRRMVSNHAWADAWLGDGWCSFDITSGLRTNGIHVRLAAGLDARDASPVSPGRPQAAASSSFRVQTQAQQ